ncbi:helix-turn-helix domain-containing protein [Teredinibacter waterburyi]|uniref:helix-turn-helix domain-containing protein n=1 Tax=Teredinibacter waterburyi TaxID=1500538 RepID=UPI00165F16D4|nr:AraC family transcriptional regulator [Teredinibacter waterburyi]
MSDLKLIASSGFHQSQPRTIPDISDYDMDNPVETLTCLYRVLAHVQDLDSINQGVSLLLEVGLKRLKFDVALVTRPVSARVFEVYACAGGGDNFFVGQHLTLSGAFCEQVLTQNETCAIPDTSLFNVHSLNVAYNNTQVGAYLGTVVDSRNTDNAVLCFLSSVGKAGDFAVEDVSFVELLAEGVASMTDQHLAQAQKKLTDQAMFALGSIKTLDEYLEQARLPEVFGVPARVVEVLERRIGQSPLSIGHIAEELNLSKRTLQRRLQQQDVSFADLRDQVRFHYSIDYLIKQHLSIDSISASLDFSDRTSFTNAFKRWTGLSPSTFRKLFRDYV